MFSRQAVTVPLLLLVLVVILTLGSCAKLGEPQSARSDDVNLGVGYVVLAQVRLMAADALKGGLISKTEAQGMLALTDTARSTLDIARDAYLHGSPDAAKRGMEIADLILLQLKRDLEARIAKKAKEKK